MEEIIFAGRAILLDIEGTTSSISYVHDVLFPYVRRELSAYLRANWDKPETIAVCERIARDAASESLRQFTGDAPPEKAQEKIAAEVLRLMDSDVKATGLKELQGLIWEHGFRSGQLRAHVYADVPPALAAWNASGLDVRIYSSGSIAAQKLFFGHTEAGDLLRYIRGRYDTNIGPKKSAASYCAIRAEMKYEAKDILFISDIVAELNVAREAGMKTAHSVRPGNAPEDSNGHPIIKSFSQVKIRSEG